MTDTTAREHDDEHRDVIADFLDGHDAPTQHNDQGDQGDQADQGDQETAPATPESESAPESAPEAPAGRGGIHLPRNDPARRWINWIATRPTPGGIMLMLAAVLFFVFAIVPVGPNGETRLFMIWKSLTGGATVPPDSPTAQADQATQAAAAVAWDGFWTVATEIVTDLQP